MAKVKGKTNLKKLVQIARRIDQRIQKQFDEHSARIKKLEKAILKGRN